MPFDEKEVSVLQNKIRGIQVTNIFKVERNRTIQNQNYIVKAAGGS